MKVHSTNWLNTSTGAEFQAKVSGKARDCWGFCFEVRLTSPLHAARATVANDNFFVEAA